VGFRGVLAGEAGLLVGAEVVALVVRSGGFEVGLGGQVVELDGALTGGVGHVVLSLQFGYWMPVEGKTVSVATTNAGLSTALRSDRDDISE
jgi:hypothetical protein